MPRFLPARAARTPPPRVAPWRLRSLGRAHLPGRVAAAAATASAASAAAAPPRAGPKLEVREEPRPCRHWPHPDQSALETARIGKHGTDGHPFQPIAKGKGEATWRGGPGSSERSTPGTRRRGLVGGTFKNWNQKMGRAPGQLLRGIGGAKRRGGSWLLRIRGTRRQKRGLDSAENKQRFWPVTEGRGRGLETALLTNR